MSDFGSSVEEKRRIVVTNPDGTLYHCIYRTKLGYKEGERDSVYDKKPYLFDQNGNNNDSLTLSDDELLHIVESAEQYDYHALTGQFLSIYRKYQVLFVLMLVTELSLSAFLTYFTWVKKDTSIYLMERMYNDVDAYQASIIFHTFYFTFCVLNVFFYPMGILCVFKKKIIFFKIYSTFALYTALCIIFILYINMLILYGFSRFLNNIIVSIILISRQHYMNSIRNFNGLVGYNTI